MAKYVINKGSNSARSVEAHDFFLRDGFFWFVNELNEPLMVAKADNVGTIRRED